MPFNIMQFSLFRLKTRPCHRVNWIFFYSVSNLDLGLGVTCTTTVTDIVSVEIEPKSHGCSQRIMMSNHLNCQAV